MKRFHIHVGVANLQRSIAFYSALFDAPPNVLEPDYAKWMLDDPRLNFAISPGPQPGVDHVGVQAEGDAEFQELRARLAAADLALAEQPDVVCCYARSAKAWLRDPDGLPWETFVTRGAATQYGDAPAEHRALAEPTAQPARASLAEAGCCAAGAPTGCC